MIRTAKRIVFESFHHKLDFWNIALTFQANQCAYFLSSKKTHDALYGCCQNPGFKLCTHLAVMPPVRASTTATHSTMVLMENMLWSPCRELWLHRMDINGLLQHASNSSYPPTHLTAAPMSPLC